MFQEPLPVYRSRPDVTGFNRSSSFDSFPQYNNSQRWPMPMPMYHSDDEFEPNVRKKKSRKGKPSKNSKGKKDKLRSGKKKKKRSKSASDHDGDNSSKASSLRDQTSRIEGLEKRKDTVSDVAASRDGSTKGSIASVDLPKTMSTAPSGISGVARRMTTHKFVLQSETKKKVPACVFWKYIFYVGLVIFGAIIGVVAYTFYNKGKMCLETEITGEKLRSYLNIRA